MRLLNLACFLCSCCAAFGQQDTTLQGDLMPEIFEEAAPQGDGENGEVDGQFFYDLLAARLARPLDLNQADETALRELGLLSDTQILNFLTYRRLAGGLISILELQAISGFDMLTIRRLLPFVAVAGELDDFQVSIRDMIREGRREWQCRWSRFLEPQAGYTTGNPTQRYLGDPNQLFIRLRHTYYNKFSAGLAAKKDRGEPFFKESNRQGFDHYSVHVFLNQYKERLRALALGDYSVSMGQGLLLYNGFGYGKGALSTSIKRNARVLRPVASAGETGYYRGVAATLRLSPKVEVSTFLSMRKRDGNLVESDSAGSGKGLFSAFIDGGLHRTAGEMARKGNIRQFNTGLVLQRRFSNGHLGINALYTRLSKTLLPRQEAYYQFYFRGDRLLNASMDYNQVFKNLNLFGEAALSPNGSIALLQGLLLVPDRKLDLALLFRHFPPQYQALEASPFGEGSNGRNETGLYAGIEFRPIAGWTFNAHFDAWRHPWLRYTADGPSRGQEFRCRLTFEKRRLLRAYAELRDRSLENNLAEGHFNHLAPVRQVNVRLHLAYHVSRALELRSRFDWGFSQTGAEERTSGVVLLQDVLFKPIGSPFSFTSRLAFFHTGGYAMRFYHYENDLLGAFSIPPYYNRGYRWYLNLRFRPWRNMVFETRIAQTRWTNQDSIGSGGEATEGPVRTQVSMQIKVGF